MFWPDRLAAGLLAPLATWVFASGLDDLFIDLCALYFRYVRPRPHQIRLRKPGEKAEKKIALMIPAWREDAVIEHMLDHNIAAIRYSNYEIFVGVYPNDVPTLARVAASGQKHSRVHHVVCPHDGPTSKADCLNWVYEGILLFEETRGTHFDLLLHHDAEDLIHPSSLRWINLYSDEYDMVQIPVLALPTPLREWTHGVYCDEFAESHLKDLHVRQRLGGFLPSCGVGTAYRRRIAQRIAWNNGGMLFRSDSLTEDYQSGLAIHRLGGSQILLDAAALADDGVPAATREYFPRRFRSAVRQRARWVAGIVLQTWEEIGWHGGPGQIYWLWRDRKGLLGNPLTILANLIFLYGLGGWLWSRRTGTEWGLGALAAGIPLLPWLLAANTGLIFVRQVSRALCVWPMYGWRHAALTPVRTLWGNLINFAATLRAIGLYVGARIRRQSMGWLKTDHVYPTTQALQRHKRRLGEVLAELHLLGEPEVEQALQGRLAGERLGECLVRVGRLAEADVYRALGIQHSLPFEPLEPDRVEPRSLDQLSPATARQLGVIPFRVVHDRYLWLAVPELPSDSLAATVADLTALTPRFQLITPSNYRRVSEALATARTASAPPQ